MRACEELTKRYSWPGELRSWCVGAVLVCLGVQVGVGVEVEVVVVVMVVVEKGRTKLSLCFLCFCSERGCYPLLLCQRVRSPLKGRQEAALVNKREERDGLGGGVEGGGDGRSN